ncbi:hypothetical protein PF003_g25043 [Phytophthora fragariae]|nr:hypothetical protein PF003_g25043 [Phytophthora fragariae]
MDFPARLYLIETPEFTRKGVMKLSKVVTPSTGGSAETVVTFVVEYLRYFLRSWGNFLQVGEDIYNSRRSSAPA